MHQCGPVESKAIVDVVIALQQNDVEFYQRAITILGGSSTECVWHCICRAAALVGALICNPEPPDERAISILAMGMSGDMRKSIPSATAVRLKSLLMLSSGYEVDAESCRELGTLTLPLLLAMVAYFMPADRSVIESMLDSASIPA